MTVTPSSRRWPYLIPLAEERRVWMEESPPPRAPRFNLMGFCFVPQLTAQTLLVCSLVRSKSESYARDPGHMSAFKRENGSVKQDEGAYSNFLESGKRRFPAGRFVGP